MPLPKVTAMPDDTVCRGDIVTLKALDVVGNLFWEFPDGTAIQDQEVAVKITESTTFVVYADVAACGTVKDAVTIFRMADAKVVLKDTSVCYEDEIELHYLEKGEIDNIVWNKGGEKLQGGENPTVQITQDETYIATAANECTSATASMHVTMMPLPFIEVASDTAVCYGESLHLNSCIIGEHEGILIWSPNTFTALTEPVIYTATVTTEKCGSMKDTMYVNVYRPLVLLPDDSRLPRYNNQQKGAKRYEFDFQTLHAENPVSYSISGTLPPGLEIKATGSIYGEPMLGPKDYKTYHVQVTAIDGHRCSVSKEYLLAPEWKAATVFLPKGDADNATFLPGFNIEVYSRNGTLLYKSKEYKGGGWDGKRNGAYVPPGTYFYKVTIWIDDIPEERMSYVVVMY
jgi:gliding motility-associated-like protein